MALGSSLPIGATVGIFGPGGVFLYPAMVNQIVPSGTNRQICAVAFPPGAAAHLVINLINHRSLTSDGSGWDFGTTVVPTGNTLPVFAL
jgi:hypothetical protein